MTDTKTKFSFGTIKIDLNPPKVFILSSKIIHIYINYYVYIIYIYMNNTKGGTATAQQSEQSSGKINSLIRIFKLIDMTTSDVPINISNVDTALSDIKTNILKANHNISIVKQFLLNKAKDSADDVGGIGAELGTLAGYHLGLITPQNDPIKTYKFKFQNNSGINIDFGIPAFNIYDTPPGLNIIDYVFNLEQNCDYISGDIVIFPGIPCELPVVEICKKTLTTKIFGKKINLGTIPYPCGLKQKTIGNIILNKNDSSPGVLYNFPGCYFKCLGSTDISGEMVVEMGSGLPLNLFIKIFKDFDITTYNSITNNGNKPIKNIQAALRGIFNIIPNFQWFLKFAKYAITFNSSGLTILNICITSIKISSTCSINYLAAGFGDKTFSINNLSYSENNYELLQNGRYISASITTNADINFEIGLGSYKIGQLVNATEDGSFFGLLIKMISSEKNKTISGTMRFNELLIAENFFNDQINSETLSNTPYKIPSLVNILKNVKTKVDLSLSLSVGITEPVPVVSFNATACFTMAQIIEFIKQYLSDFIVDALLMSIDAQSFFANIQLDVIEYMIRPSTLPSFVRSNVDLLNRKFEYARNIFKGYVTIGIMESTSFLQKIIPAPNTTLCYTFSCPI